jgi:hypothetical protein
VVHFRARLSQVTKLVALLLNFGCKSDFQYQGDRFLLNVIDSLTDDAMLKSTSIVYLVTYPYKTMSDFRVFSIGMVSSNIAPVGPMALPL